MLRGLGRPLAGVPDTALARLDAGLTIATAAATSERITALDDALFASPYADGALEAVWAGWETCRFPTDDTLVAVFSEHGWGCQPSGAFLQSRWAALPVTRRRALLRTAMVEHTMVFSSLGAWAEAMLVLADGALASGVWRVLASRLSVEEFEAARFLYALGGECTLLPRH